MKPGRIVFVGTLVAAIVAVAVANAAPTYNAVLSYAGAGAAGCATATPSASCVLPLYSAGGSSMIGFVLHRLTNNGSAEISAVDEHGNVTWTRLLPNVVGTCAYPHGWLGNTGLYCNGGALFGGFDYDGDGTPDIAVVEKADIGTSCGGQPMQQSSLGFFSGGGGSHSEPLVALPDLCFGYLTPPARIQQWKETSVLFGAGTTELAVFPGYADGLAWYLTHQDSGFTSATPLSFPGRVDTVAGSCTGLTAPFDNAVLNPAANIPARSTSRKFVCNSHQANGLIVMIDGAPRLVFFTSYRVLQYRVGPLGPMQLIRDHPFVQGDSVDPNLAGRNYGFIGQDPANPHKVVELAGTDAATVYRDMAKGSYDPTDLGEIERHVAIYDLVADSTGAGGASGGGLDDRGYGTIHDYAGQAWANYRNRLVYPANPFVAATSAVAAQGGSRISYNVLGTDLRWHLHITYPGSTRDRYVLDDRFLWDIRDVDGDGTQEWLISHTQHVGTGPDMPVWQTTLYHWIEGPAPVLNPARTLPGVPFLVPTFRTPTASTSRGYLFPALTVDRGEPTLLMERQGSTAPILCSPITGSCAS